MAATPGRINQLLAAWTGDMAFVLDRLEQLNRSDASGRFTGRLALARVGVFGHSLGGGRPRNSATTIPGARQGSTWTVRH
jgi:hypothetical protein